MDLFSTILTPRERTTVFLCTAAASAALCSTGFSAVRKFYNARQKKEARNFHHVHYFFNIFCYGLIILFTQCVWQLVYPWIGQDDTLLWNPELSTFDWQLLPNVLYGIQLGYYAFDMVLALLHRDEKKERKDAIMEFVHHVVVFLLIFSSRSLGQMRIGFQLALIMDPTDFVISIGKTLVYAKIEPAATVVFVLFVGVWCYLRLYIYAVKMLIPAYSVSTVVMDEYGIPWQYHQWFLFNAALWAIWAMQWVWTYHIFRISYKKIVEGRLEDVRYDEQQKKD